MIDFGAFRAEDGTPIYLQIIKYLKQGVVSGAVADGDELPSRRVLSALLGLNPNTVQKACRMLEEEGLLVSHAGAKSCVRVTPELRERVRAELIRSDAVAAASATPCRCPASSTRRKSPPSPSNAPERPQKGALLFCPLTGKLYYAYNTVKETVLLD